MSLGFASLQVPHSLVHKAMGFFQLVLVLTLAAIPGLSNAQVTVRANVAGVFTRASQLMDCDANGGLWETRPGDGGIPYCYMPPQILLNDGNIPKQIPKGLTRYSPAECTAPYLTEDTGWTVGEIQVPPELNEYFDYWRGEVSTQRLKEVRRLRVQTMALDPNTRQCILGRAYYFGVERITPRLEDQTCKRGNPTLVGAGSKLHIIDYSDFAGVPFKWQYSSFCPATSVSQIGANWLHTYSRSLRYTAQATSVPATVLVGRSDGKTGIFQFIQNKWTAQVPTRGKLWQTSSATGEPTGWRVFFEDAAEIEVYDVQGKLIEVVDLRGASAQLTYSTDTQPKLLKAIDTRSGRSLYFNLNATQQLSSITGPDGAQLKIGLDENLPGGTRAQGILTSVIYPGGSITRYHYEDTRFPTSLTGVTDESAIRFSKYTYDAGGRVESTGRGMNAEIEHKAFSYLNNKSIETDALGAVRTFQFADIASARLINSIAQPSGNGGGAIQSQIGYDSMGNATNKDDFKGNRVCMAYDSTRNLETARVEGLSNTANCTNLTIPGATLPVGSRKISTQWHLDWHLVTKSAEPAKITTMIYNGQPDAFAGGTLASCAPTDAFLPDGKPIAVLCRRVEQATVDTTGALGFDATLQSGVSARENKYSYDRWGQVTTVRLNTRSNRWKPWLTRVSERRRVVSI